VTSILMVGQHYIEKHYGKGVDNLVPTVVNPLAKKAAAVKTATGPTASTTKTEENAQ
jgi:polar amino acid transport system permease protein